MLSDIKMFFADQAIDSNAFTAVPGDCSASQQTVFSITISCSNKLIVPHTTIVDFYFYEPDSGSEYRNILGPLDIKASQKCTVSLPSFTLNAAFFFAEQGGRQAEAVLALKNMGNLPANVRFNTGTVNNTEGHFMVKDHDGKDIALLRTALSAAITPPVSNPLPAWNNRFSLALRQSMLSGWGASP